MKISDFELYASLFLTTRRGSIPNDSFNYDGPRNLDSVLSYTWEQKGGGPSGEFKEEAHAVI